MKRRRKAKPPPPPPAPPRWRPARWAPEAALFAALLGLYLTCVSREIGGNLGGDGVVYYLLGKALAAGRGYVDLYLPGEPAHLKYPFLFPLLLAFWHRLLEEPLPAMHVMVAAANAGSAVALGSLLGRRLGSRGTGLALAAAVAAIPAVYLQTLHLLTEPVYCLACFSALWLMERPDQVGPVRALAVMLLVLAAYFTRTAGVALAAAVAVGWWRTGARIPLGRSERRLWPWFVLLFAAAAGAWALRNRLAGGASPYVSDLLLRDPYQPNLGPAGPMDLLHRMGANLFYYSPQFAGYALAPVWSTRLMVLGWAAGLLAAAGWVREVLRGPRALEGFYLLSLVIVVGWPFQELRFVEPLLPLSLYYVLRGASWPARSRAPITFKVLLALVLLSEALVLPGLVAERLRHAPLPAEPVFVKGYGWWREPVIDLANYDLGLKDRPEAPAIVRDYGEYLVINRVAGKMVEPRAVLVSRKPMVTYYLSGRKTVPLLYDSDPRAQWRYFLANRADCLVVGLNERELDGVFEDWDRAGDRRLEMMAEAPAGRAALIRINRGLAPGSLTGQDQGRP